MMDCFSSSSWIFFLLLLLLLILLLLLSSLLLLSLQFFFSNSCCPASKSLLVYFWMILYIPYVYIWKYVFIGCCLANQISSKECCSKTNCFLFNFLLQDRLTVSREAYPCLSIAISKIYRDGGIGAFYAGISPTLIGMLPYSTCYYFMYEKLKTSYCQAKNKKSLNRPEMLLLGALSGEKHGLHNTMWSLWKFSLGWFQYKLKRQAHSIPFDKDNEKLRSPLPILFSLPVGTV